MQHGREGINALCEGRELPRFVIKNVIETDFTYHGVDLRTFMKTKWEGRVQMSRIYCWKGQFHLTFHLAKGKVR